MTNQQQPEEPRRPRGPSSWAERLYGNTAEYVAAWCRLWSLTYSVLTVAFALLLAFQPSWSALAALLVIVAALAAHLWLGFFYLANPEWKESKTDG